MPKVIIDSQKCTHCFTCYDICPMDVYSKIEDGRLLIKKPQECVACRECEIQCPVQCIKIEE